MAPEVFNYRKFLKDLGDELTLSDVGSLKFVCRGKINAGSLDKIPNNKPLQFLKLLEERLLITEDNLTWLRSILKEIQRIDLVRKIPAELCQQNVDMVDGGAMASPVSDGVDVVSPYRTLLKSVADELTTDNIDEMKFLLDVPDGKAEKMNDGQCMLTYLETKGQLSENNFKDLKDLLINVSRLDLVKKIEKCPNNEAQTLPTSRETDTAPRYNMRQKPYGFALIINIKTFKGKTDDGLILNERRGSVVDVENLEKLWENLGFVVESHSDLMAHQIYTVVQDMAANIDQNQSSSCFVCCIMTHGKLGMIYGSDSKHINIKGITEFFKEDKCPALAGKPKLFFIQACRGREQLTGRSTHPVNPVASKPHPTTTAPPHLTMPQPRNTSTLDTDATPFTGTTADVADGDDDDSLFRHNADPNESHFLLGYSTAPGYVSFRSIDHGTWYMSALVKIFGAHYVNEDVLEMLVRVNCKVTDAYTSKGYKQCPVPVFTLTKKVYF